MIVVQQAEEDVYALLGRESWQMAMEDSYKFSNKWLLCCSDERIPRFRTIHPACLFGSGAGLSNRQTEKICKRLVELPIMISYHDDCAACDNDEQAEEIAREMAGRLRHSKIYRFGYGNNRATMIGEKGCHDARVLIVNCYGINTWYLSRDSVWPKFMEISPWLYDSEILSEQLRTSRSVLNKDAIVIIASKERQLIKQVEDVLNDFTCISI